MVYPDGLECGLFICELHDDIHPLRDFFPVVPTMKILIAKNYIDLGQYHIAAILNESPKARPFGSGTKMFASQSSVSGTSFISLCEVYMHRNRQSIINWKCSS